MFDYFFAARELSFRVLIGGASSSSCEKADSGEDIVVEYQPDGSSTFAQLMLLGYNRKIHTQKVTVNYNTYRLCPLPLTEFLTARTVTVRLPAAATTKRTALKWRQTTNSGLNLDEWAIDHVSITGANYQQQIRIILLEDFDLIPQFPYVASRQLVILCGGCDLVCSGTKWQSISGGTVRTPDCGSIDVTGYSAQAAFFSGVSTSSRFIETVGLDLSTAK